MAVYRAPMRSRLDEVEAARAVERALDLGVCGVGGRLRVVPRSLEDALDLVAAEHGERTAARLRRFAAVPEGAEVWTRDAGGTFHVGVLTGAWRWDGDAAAYEADLQHVRSCRWTTPSSGVPHAVLASFERGGRNFQRVTALP